MKPAFVIICLAVIHLSAFAQTEKGRFLIGGSGDISIVRQGTDGGFNLSVNPALGIFVAKNFAIGGRYTLGVVSSKTLDTRTGEYNTVITFASGIGPLMKYYIGKKQLKGVISANVNYLTATTLKGGVASAHGFSATGLVGMAFFLNQHISVESGLYISGISFTRQLPTTRIGFSVSFFTFLNKKKQE